MTSIHSSLIYVKISDQIFPSLSPPARSKWRRYTLLSLSIARCQGEDPNMVNLISANLGPMVALEVETSKKRKIDPVLLIFVFFFCFANRDWLIYLSRANVSVSRLKD